MLTDDNPGLRADLSDHHQTGVAAVAAQPGGKPQWTRLLAAYRDPNPARSLFEIAITFLPFAGLWTLAWTAVHLGYWQLSLLPSLLAGGLLMRLFMIQHDCGHGAFFRNRLANDWAGRAIGVLTLTPYDAWRRAHAQHHAGAGNLHRRGIGDIDTLTVGEYRALTLWGRLRYRVYRNPLVMFGVGPIYLFILRHRFPLARRGSSHYHLPAGLRWMTANIGVHHVHHLASRIPYYRLQRVLRDHPELAEASRLTLRQSLGCVRLALWDESQKRLVSFREARRQHGGETAG